MLEHQIAVSLLPSVKSLVRLSNTLSMAMQYAPSSSLLTFQRNKMLRYLSTPYTIAPPFIFQKFLATARGISNANSHLKEPSWSHLIDRYVDEIEMYRTALALVKDAQA